MASAPQAYDPTSPTPYVAPDPTPPPKESPFQGQPGVPLQQMGNITHGGAIAGVFDNLLHGFVNGYAQGEQHKALTLKKKQDDLTASYNADAKRAYDVAQSQIASTGKIDPSSEDYKAAKSAVDGSWGALQDFRGQLLQQQPGAKKKGKKTGDDQSPAMILADPKSTPQDKAQALYAMSKQAGPPIFGQIQTLAGRAASPQAQSEFKAAGDTAATQQSQASTNRQLFDKVNELSTLVTKENPTEEDKQKITALKGQIADIREALNPSKITAAQAHRYSEDGKEEYEVDQNGNEIPNTRRPRSAAANKPVRAWKVGANGKPVGMMIDPSTNQEVPGSENPDLIPPPSMLQHISNGVYVYTDNNGEVHKVPIQRSTSPVLPKGEGAPANTPGLPAEHSTNTDHPNHPDHTGVAPKTVNTASTHSDVIGHKGVPRAKVDDLDKDTNTQYQKAVDAFNKTVDDSNDPALKLTPDQKAAMKKRAYDRLQEENANIGKEHSQRMRDLGLIPKEDSAKQAGAEAKPASKGTVKKSAFLHENPGATDADWNAIKPQLKAQNYETVDN